MSNQHGGRRPGAGRPKGTGTRFNEPTVVKRIPVSKVSDVDRLISSPKPTFAAQSSAKAATIITIRAATLFPEKQERPLFASRVPAGFLSPADDYIDMHLDLNDYVIDCPAATYHVQVSGDSMIHAGIVDGDTLVVNRSLEPTNNAIVVAIMDGEPTVKRLFLEASNIQLRPENPAYLVIHIGEEQDLQIWGVVTGVVRKL